MIEVVGGPGVSDGGGDVLVVPVFKDLVWGPGAELVASAVGDWLEPYLVAQDFSGKAGHRFVDGIIDNFVDQMMQTSVGSISDVQTVPLSNML